MKYEILYDFRSTNPYAVIQRDDYEGESFFYIHSRHAGLETAQLVKEALEARQARDLEESK